jgi:hypothetical protein
MKADPSRVRAPLNGKRFGAFLRRLTGSASGDIRRGAAGPLAPGEIGAMLVELGTFVKEPMSGNGQARAKLPRQRLT